MPRKWFSVLLVVTVATGAGIAPAQEVFQFLFHPPVGNRLQVVYEARGTLLVRGLPGAGDGQNLRFESVVGVTEVAREDLGGAMMIETTIDSVFARYRAPNNQAWIELPVPYQPTGMDRRVRDSLFVSTALDGSRDPFFLNVARGLRMMAEVPLPDVPVSVGGSWPIEFQFPFTSQIPSNSALLITVDFMASGTARLDSVVPRSTDTLAFVSMAASLHAATLPSAYSYPTGDLPVTMTGSLTGSHIWSTGWHGWAGSSLRVTVDHRVEGLQGATMTTTLTSSTRVGS